MQHLLDLEALKARRRDFTAGAIVQTESLIRGGAMGLAALALVEIVFVDAGDKGIRLGIWVANVLSSLSMFSVNLHRSLLALRSGVVDHWLSLLIGGIELLVYLVIIPREDNPYSWLAWFPLLLVANVLLLSIIQHQLAVFRISDLPRELQTLAVSHIDWMRQSRLGAAANILLLAGLTPLLFSAPRDGPYFSIVVWATILLQMAFVIAVMADIYRRSTKVAETVDKAVDEAAAQPLAAAR